MTTWKEYEVKSTVELVALFQRNTGTKAEKEYAFYAIVNRFKKDLLEKCEINCNRYGHPPNVAEIITENTFKAYAKNGKFDPKTGKGKTPDDSFRIYLYGIAKNELINYYKAEEKKHNGQLYDGNEKIITDLPKIDLERLDKASRIKFEIIQSLPASHRTVYLTYKAHEKLGVNLPKRLLEELRVHLGNISQTTIRSYKKEANDKIKEGLKIMEMTLNY